MSRTQSDVATGGFQTGAVEPATLLQGIRGALPIVVGYLPIAFSFGVAATGFGFSAGEAVLLSAVVYAGASQFLALPLLVGGTPCWSAVLPCSR
jgi:predicted branched-subunit amino acid permease